MYQFNTVTAGVLIHAATKPDRRALIWQDNAITYRMLEKNARLTAKKLLSVGVRPKDKIVYSLYPSPAFFYTYLSCGMIGACAVGVAFQSTAEAASVIVDESHPKAIVCGAALADMYRSIAPSVPVITDDELLADELTESDIAKLDELQSEVGLDDPFLVLYTSGTTHKPKGALLTHRNVLASSVLQNKYLSNIGFREDDIVPHCFPVNHVSGAIESGIAPLIGGGCLVLLPKFHPVTYLELTQKYKITIMCGVPAMWAMLLNVLKVQKFDTSSVRLCLSGAAPLSRTMAEGLKQICPVCVNPLGMTETCGLCSYFPDGTSTEQLCSTVGIIYPEIDFKLIDENGSIVKPGEIGQICYRGDSIISRYVSVELRHDDEGYFLTGDMGYMGSDGLLHLCGRNDDMFTVGGYNVYPQEIEDLLLTYPGITGAVVMPIPHHSMGNVCRAYITVSEEVDFEAVEAFAAKHLIYYKVPKNYKIVDKFPVNALGKISKKVLAKEIEEEFYQR